MSGIAEVLLNLGYPVSGSDVVVSEATRHLAALGGVISIGHRAESLGSAEVVVISSAVKRDNPEVLAARRRNIPVIPRAEMLAELMRLKYAIAIAGSHGKTTTTSLLAAVLAQAGLDPTTVVGGKINVLGSNARVGKSHLMVAEADESDGSFLHLLPSIAVVTNIDPEHMDHYGTMDKLADAFTNFCNRVPFYGLNVLCIDSPSVRALLPRIEKRAVTYGTSSDADYRLEKVELDHFALRFYASRRGEPIGAFPLKMVGKHNALNALATIAVADELDVSMDVARAGLESFGGVDRRFTVRGSVGGITVVDDYGHHPSEIRATLEGARKAFGQRIVVAFQPHRYSRTRDLFEDFVGAFDDADLVFLTSIYPGGEAPVPGVSAVHLVDRLRARSDRPVHFAEAQADLAVAMLPHLRAGDLVITLGAGDITGTAADLLRILKA